MEIGDKQRYEAILLNFKECIDSFNVEVKISKYNYRNK